MAVVLRQPRHLQGPAVVRYANARTATVSRATAICVSVSAADVQNRAIEVRERSSEALSHSLMDRIRINHDQLVENRRLTNRDLLDEVA